MAESVLYKLRPFKRYIFWPLFAYTSLLAIIVAFLIYSVIGNEHFHEAQDDLLGIAKRTAAFIPVETHERISASNDMRTEDYELLELYLQSIMAGNDKIDDIYTLRPTSKAHVMEFVMSGAQTQDKDGDGEIEENEQKALLGETYDTSELPELEAAWLEPTVDKKINIDKWGAFLSGYAPLKNTKGETVAILGVDFTAETIASERHLLLQRVLIGLGITIPLIALMSAFLTRIASGPFMIFVRAMDRIRHGEYAYRIPHGKSRESHIVAELFNNYKDMLLKAGAEEKEKNSTHKKEERESS